MTPLVGAFLGLALIQGQQAAPPDHPRQASATESRSVADERFDLDIGERRVTERNFSASTDVTAEDAGGHGLRVGVGAAVRAEEIDVTLRNVRGRVVFRGSLERVLERLGIRGGVTTP